MAPSHQAVVTWLLAPGGSDGCLDWSAGRNLGGHSTFEGSGTSNNIRITSIGEGGIGWESSFNETEVLGTGSGYRAPDVFVFFKSRGNQEIGGFLDHWNGGLRSRSLDNIKELWKCRFGGRMSVKKILRTAVAAQLGLQGNKGSILSEWFELH